MANLYANAVNLGTAPETFLDELPLERLAYELVDTGDQLLDQVAVEPGRRLIRQRNGPAPGRTSSVRGKRS